MTPENKLEKGREAFRRQAWSDAYNLLSSADRETPLEAGDLELLAEAAYLVGKSDDCTDGWNRAHHAFLKQDKTKQAARCAFWLGMILLNQGNSAQGGGWLARAGRLVDDYRQDCVEKGFLLVPKGLQSLGAGDHQKAHKLFNRAVEIGSRFNNSDLVTLGRLGRGQALVLQNKIDEGTTLFDEVMVAVLSDEISPIVTGIAYCAVIETCQKIYDLGRAREWTGALSSWCDSHPDLVPYRGQCLVRRAEIMQLHGEWNSAVNEAERAAELLTQPPGGRAAGEAFYRQGELYRLQGNFVRAEELYRHAHKSGRKPQPGLALLRLAGGKVDLAQTAISQSEEEEEDPRSRSRLLPAYVEIMLAAGKVAEAQAAAEELTEIASIFQAPFLRAIADFSMGSVTFAEGQPRAALHKLQESLKVMKEIEATYETARVRVLTGLASRELGDNDTAEMELDAAREMFQQLGAAPDVKKIDSLIKNTASGSGNAHGLTPREMEVLQLLATGKTNNTIASELFISERTVDRHVSNILAKLDVPTRAAATAYAYEHELV